MSESYEGIVFRASEDDARTILASLKPTERLGLHRLVSEAWGICRVADRRRHFEPRVLDDLAARVSRRTDTAVSVAYDNSSGFRSAAVYEAGAAVRRFGEGDERWVATDESGHPIAGSGRLTVGDLKPDVEYECVESAIDLAIKALGEPRLPGALLKEAFCYREALAISEPPDG